MGGRIYDMRVLIALTLLLVGCSERSFTVEVPEGYVGWATVQFGRAGCGDSRSTTRTTIRLRPDGTGCTSVRRLPQTSFFQRFVYVSGDRETKELPITGWGEGGMIWAESTEIDGHEWRFFIGSENQLNASWKARAATTKGSVPRPLPPNSPLQPTATAAPSP